MISGCANRPLTFQAITIWRDELLNEDILLRDVIDLDATFGRSDGRGRREGAEPVVDNPQRETASPKTRNPTSPSYDADGNPIVKSDDDDEDDDQANMSLAAMEAALKPRVLETLERIAQHYERLSEMQDCGCRPR